MKLVRLSVGKATRSILCFSSWALAFAFAKRIVCGGVGVVGEALSGFLSENRSFAVHEAHGTSAMDGSKL
jgi:hypothetical protein